MPPDETPERAEESGTGPREGSGPSRVPAVGDHVALRKPHACGGYQWTVTRLGADVGLLCDTCGRRVLLARREFTRRLQG
ncbi:MAG: DUF951 domain-containing protein [Armatimonadota bacterium]